MSELAERLLALPSFPDRMPSLDPQLAPADPEPLFLEWLDDAIASGVRQPHAMTLITVRDDGTPVGRTVIIKDIDAHGVQFSTHRASRKGQQLVADDRATLLFFWRETGRQVRITGRVHELSAADSAEDWEKRPSYDEKPNPDWQLYALEPDEFEFLQAREDRKHTRVEYHRDGGSWENGIVETPAG